MKKLHLHSKNPNIKKRHNHKSFFFLFFSISLYSFLCIVILIVLDNKFVLSNHISWLLGWIMALFYGFIPRLSLLFESSFFKMKKNASVDPHIQILIDHSTLPENNEFVSFQTLDDIDNNQWQTGFFSIQEQGFFVGEEPNYSFTSAFDVVHWKPYLH